MAPPVAVKNYRLMGERLIYLFIYFYLCVFFLVVAVVNIKKVSVINEMFLRVGTLARSIR